MKLPCSTNTHQKLEMYAALLDLEPPPSRSIPASLSRAVSSALGSLLAQAVSRPPTILLSEFDALIWHSCFTEPLIPRDLLPEAYDALCYLQIDVLGNADLEDYINQYESESRNNSKRDAKLFHSIYDGKELSSNVITHIRPLTEEDLRVIQAAWVRSPVVPTLHVNSWREPVSDKQHIYPSSRGTCKQIIGHSPIFFQKRTAQWLDRMGEINKRLSYKRINRSIPEVELAEKSIPDWQQSGWTF